MFTLALTLGFGDGCISPEFSGNGFVDREATTRSPTYIWINSWMRTYDDHDRQYDEKFKMSNEQPVCLYRIPNAYRVAFERDPKGPRGPPRPPHHKHRHWINMQYSGNWRHSTNSFFSIAQSSYSNLHLITQAENSTLILNDETLTQKPISKTDIHGLPPREASRGPPRPPPSWAST